MKLKEFYEKIYNKIFSVPLFKKLLKIPGVEKLLQYEIVSYLFFGVLTTAVNILTYLGAGLLVGDGYEEKILYTLKISSFIFDIQWLYIINAIAWLVSVLFSFVTNKLFVFESSSWKLKTVFKELIPFLGARVLTLIVFEELVYILLVNLFGVKYHLIYKLLIAVFVVLTNYIASKLVVFRKKTTKEQEDKNA